MVIFLKPLLWGQLVTLISLVTISLNAAGVWGQAEPKEKVLMCYYNSMSFWREGLGKFEAKNIDPNLCTHLIYSFIGLKPNTNKLYSRDPYLDLGPGEVEPDPDPPEEGQGENNRGGLDMIRKTVQLRDGINGTTTSGNPNLKVLISVGGNLQSSRSFSNMARHLANRTQFIQSAIAYIEKYNLDGIDIWWEYPANGDGRPEDKENYIYFLQEMREALNNLSDSSAGRTYFLTAAFGCRKEVIDAGYDLIQLSKYLDSLHLMCFDFKMFSDETEDSQKIGHHSPIHSKESESAEDQQLTSEFGVNYFIELGAPADKLVLGVSSYARTYELGIPEYNNFYDRALGLGPPGSYTLQPGILAYYEICLEMKNNLEGWQLRFDYQYGIPYASNDTVWIGYDNEFSAQEKVDFAISKGLGGLMVQSIDLDDFNNQCGGWYPFPIVASIKDRISANITYTLK